MRALRASALTKPEFISKAIAIHGNKYDYSKANPKTTKDAVTIVCPEHGEFEQSITVHLFYKCGCPQCVARLRNTTTEQFIRRARHAHGNKYDYSKTEYKRSDLPVTITCPIHGDFEQIASVHSIRGHGCARCNVVGFTRSDFIEVANKYGNAILYVIKCWSYTEVFYKVGITSKNVHERFKNCLPYEYEVVAEVQGSGSDIYDLETKLHKKLKDYRYNPSVKFGGHTECFSRIDDILDVLEVNK